mmetsp:Transcript_4974/g.11518  ORF Transcript_4974/g.11518 Transcript_4974/m.11518 type:complete len:216 (+) Transcript_4974:54-701(+)
MEPSSRTRSLRSPDSIARLICNGKREEASLRLENPQDEDLEAQYHGRTAIDWAASLGESDLLEKLISLGARASFQSPSSVLKTPLLQNAARFNHADCLEVLTRKTDVDIDALDHIDGSAAVHHAAKVGLRLKGLQALEDAGALMDLPDAKGRTPLSIAREAHAFECVKFLESPRVKNNIHLRSMNRSAFFRVLTQCPSVPFELPRDISDIVQQFL